MTHKILIIGATSAIAQAIAKRYAKFPCTLFLAARNTTHLDILANDLRLRSQNKIFTYTADFTDASQHEALLQQADHDLNGIDSVIIAYGSLPNQKSCEQSVTETYQQLEINFLSVVALLTLLANYFEARRAGNITVITSVAGDRGRKSNYVYGAAKGALSIFLQGLRNRLNAVHVNVLTVKPGFVDTPMTKDFKKGILWSSPEYVADKICRAVDKKRTVVYVPFFWRYIMWVVRVIPEWVFAKLSL